MKVDQKSFEAFQKEAGEKSREIWLAGLGLFAAAEEEGDKLFKEFSEKGKELITKGEELEKKGVKMGKDVGKEIGSRFDDAVGYVEEKMHSMLHAAGFSSQEEVKELSSKVDRLTKTVAELTRKLDETKTKKTSAAK